MSATLDRRSFMGTLLAGVVAPAFLPGASRLWKPPTIWVPCLRYAYYINSIGANYTSSKICSVPLKNWKRGNVVVPDEIVEGYRLVAEDFFPTKETFESLAAHLPIKRIFHGL